MFGIPGKAAITLTPAAVRRVRQIMDTGGSAGLRVGVRKGGCAGMEYTLEHATEVGAHDAVVEQDGARVMIAPMAQMFLIGTEIDFETTLLDSGFRFRNPNVAESCGCGESIRFNENAGADQG